MEEIKDLMKSFDFSSPEPLHLVGELNFIRTHNDFIKVCLNVLQSTKILMQLMKVLRQKEFPEQYRHLLMKHLKQLEELVAKLMIHLNTAFNSKEQICIPATCITFECIKKVLVNIIIQLYVFLEKEITEDYLIALIVQVFIINRNR